MRNKQESKSMEVGQNKTSQTFLAKFISPHGVLKRGRLENERGRSSLKALTGIIASDFLPLFFSVKHIHLVQIPKLK
jgi:hypothetical protein